MSYSGFPEAQISPILHYSNLMDLRGHTSVAQLPAHGFSYNVSLLLLQNFSRPPGTVFYEKSELETFSKTADLELVRSSVLLSPAFFNPHPGFLLDPGY